MIWDRLSILQGFVPYGARAEAARQAYRWTEAAKADSRLCLDLLQLGNILVAQSADIADGWPTPVLPDPAQLAYAAGRRDLALQLLALMNLTPLQLQAMMKEPDRDAK